MAYAAHDKIARSLGVLIGISISSLAGARDFGRILCVGDSTTGGSRGVFGYRESLYDILTAEHDKFTFVGPIDWGGFHGVHGAHTNVHAGFSGWSTPHLLHGREGFASMGCLIQWLQEYHPDTVIFSSGTLDVWDMRRDWRWTPAAHYDVSVQMHNRYWMVLNTIFQLNPQIQVVFASPYRYLPEGTNSYKYRFNQSLFPVMESTAAEFVRSGANMKLVDLWSPFSNTIGEYTLSDGFHPNERAAVKTARLIYDALQAGSSRTLPGIRPVPK